MTWGITVGLIIVGLVFALFASIIFQEARTHRFWRTKVREGDLEMIRQLIQAEVERWREERSPKGMPASVWSGVQEVEVLEIGRDYLRSSSTAEPHFALVSGERREVDTALDQAKRVTATLAERFMYDVPHVRLDRVQIDMYSTFREADGEPSQRCILTTLVRRAVAAEIDWDDAAPELIAERLGASYSVDRQGVVQPIEPDDEAVRVSLNGSSGGPEAVF